ncbi:GNAT family N-acetyltransferase [Aestuariibaculum sediminum]|uniref:GNAT family N-acetyltransferase n=1 Tax=Aestuariibaculum sediminum TaxID=2770637 RepID=A0A8J6QCL3_9FLAO|nr:GNAT family N-acetyltransferase [Aestuariibaculum sediminum]MBD0833646.1 GNAT family N-acetyltransferase [Aestuariibaculum sediminum]
MNIRKGTTDDLEVLKEVGQRTFIETFAPHNSEENMKNYLENGFSEEKLQIELNDPYSEFYFIELKGHVIGYLKVNFGPSQTELQDDQSLEIERIYVLKLFHGKKVGQLLYEKAIDMAKTRHLKYVWLGVWEKNERAIRFYEKNGFEAFDTHVFELGNDKQTDILMKLNLVY